MSLEAAIQENTSAVRELIKYLTAQSLEKPAPAAKVARAPAPAPVPTPAPTPAPTPTPAAAAPAPVVVAFNDLREAFLRAVTAKEIDAPSFLAKFGIDATAGGKLSHLNESQWGAAIEAIRQAGAK